MKKIYNQQQGMAMVIIITVCFVVLVSVGIGATIIANNLEKISMGSGRERAEINAQSGLERVRGMREIDGHLFDACSEGDCIDTSAGGCGVCSSTIYNVGDNRHRVRIQTMTAPTVGEDPHAGTVTLLSTGFYKNIKRERTITMCLDYCTVGGYNCGNDGCGGQCGTCGVGETCQGGVCQGAQTGCGDVSIECSGDCVAGETCGGGKVIDQDAHIVAVGGGCSDIYGTDCGGKNSDNLALQWDKDDYEDTGATDADNGETNAEILRNLGGGTIADPFEVVKFCEDLSVNGFDDWYLPSQNELSLISSAYSNNFIDKIYEDVCYWSSTEQDTATAFQLQIAGITAVDCGGEKSTPIYFRCLRRY